MMKDFSLQTGAILNSRIALSLRKKSSRVIMPEFLFSELPLGWLKEMSKLAYWKQEKKIQIAMEAKMDEFFDTSRMGNRKDS